MNVLYRYFLILAACISLLIGIQIPNFVDQYEKRLDAHFIEVQNNLRGYQEIADNSSGGSIEALIRKHEASDDTTFKAEAKPIKNIYERYVRFRDEKLALDTGFVRKVVTILANRDRELIAETYQQYSATIPLNRLAVLSGAAFAAAVLLVLELLRAAIAGLAGLGSSPVRRVPRATV